MQPYGGPWLKICRIQAQASLKNAGVYLGSNVTASSDIDEVVRDADLIVFASPHQYMHNIIRKLMGKVGSRATGVLPLVSF